MSITAITEHQATNGGHTINYLAAGPEDGPMVIFVHGWPELSISWRGQLPCFAALGFRAIAPDMRGYGRSTVYRRHEDYAQEKVVGDMLALLASLGAEKAIWVGHDWGAPTVWSIASHHPERCVAVANISVPYYTLERGIDAMLPLVDRSIYPSDRFPFGQWGYMRFYEQHFDRVRQVFETNPYNTVKALFRRGNPEALGRPNPNADIFETGGWFRGAATAPDLPRDDAVVSEEDLRIYAEALTRNGFFGPDSYYMNDAANVAYAARAVNGGHLDMPVLFLAARYDITCESVLSRLAEPMRAYCRSLTEGVIDSGHWAAQEKPREVNAALVRWLATKVADAWPG